MNENRTAMKPADFRPQAEVTIANECQALIERAHGFYLLGLYAEAAQELAAISPPEHWQVRVASLKCRVAFAMGDMQTVVALGSGYHRTPGQPASFYSVIAIALHNCGRWREAVEAEEMRMSQYGATPDDHYGLACYYGKALQMEPALLQLAKGLRDHAPNRLKALVDTDLQPFWTRLPFTPLTPRMKEVLYSPTICALRSTSLSGAIALQFDAAERASLPAGFGRWLEFDQVSHLLKLSPSAPAGVRQRFTEWGRNRALATLRLVRRAMQRVRPPQPSPEQRAEYLKLSTVPLPGYSLSERDLRMACDTLLRLRDTSIDPELRSEYHDELCDLTHSRLIESMFLKCEDFENELQH